MPFPNYWSPADIVVTNPRGRLSASGFPEFNSLRGIYDDDLTARGAIL
jgi:hypothetical protein